jgi:hypothetical protein
MANYISLDPKHTTFAGVDDPEMQTLHAYRMLTTWLVAALIQEGHIHITRQSLDAAIAHLDSCAEQPTFRTQQFADGCEDIELVRYEPPATAT